MPAKQILPRVGCCGFAQAQRKYFETHRCIEVNTSFYNLPRLETAARWRAAAPDGFEFAMKAWQVITHAATSPTYRRTRIDSRDREHCGHFGYNPTIRWAWNETFAVAKTLGVFLVLFQCPPSFRANNDNIARLRSFFEHAKRGKFFMGWEPRGGWNDELVGALCKELDLIHVVDPFQRLPAVNGKIRYFRLHGVTGPRHRFSREELAKLRGIAAGKPPAYCLFNNVGMWEDARRFASTL